MNSLSSESLGFSLRLGLCFCMFKTMASCLVQGLCRLGLKQVYVTVGFRLDRLKGLDRFEAGSWLFVCLSLTQVRLAVCLKQCGGSFETCFSFCVTSLTGNHLIEQELRKFGIVHQIENVGSHFKEVVMFMWPFELNKPADGLKNRFKDGGDSGDCEDLINELINKMN
ncbi:unnamed protein product [Vicia faba]|uniref:Uncharacterized protein n=1 Tax=Vicia faba TaxID=3906 RepID=A0AAV1AB34_VICFA|nr:unnamed protein product [Vicia faba]